MWAPSDELEANMVYVMDVLNEPDIYPKELVEALRNQEKGILPGFMEEKSIEGYIIQPGVVGVHPDAPKAVKDEWMEYWRSYSPIIN